MEETIKGAYRSEKPLVISLKQARFDYYKTTPTGVKTARYITALETALETAREALRIISEDVGGGFNSVEYAVDVLCNLDRAASTEPERRIKNENHSDR